MCQTKHNYTAVQEPVIEQCDFVTLSIMLTQQIAHYSYIAIYSKWQKLRLWFFFRSTDRPYKKCIEKIREAKNQLSLT